MTDKLSYKTKRCPKCETEKRCVEFSKKSSSKDGYQNSCKGCMKYYKNSNPKRVAALDKAYREANSERIAARQKAHYEANKDLYIKRARARHKANTHKIAAYQKAYREANPERIAKAKVKHHKHKLETDPLYRLKSIIKCSIRRAMKAQGYKKTARTHEIIGCSYEELQKHLQKSFEANYCITFHQRNTSRQLHIDHIIPLATAKSEEAVIKLNHYSNLQYLYASDNFNKAAKLDWKLKDV